jgi:biopolymer transport protein TolR
MAMTSSGRGVPAAEMNVTPLIDVLLVLLIIFMIILPQHKNGEWADIPQKSDQANATRPDSPIVIQLENKGEGARPALKINQQEIGWDSLESRLRDIFKARPERIAFLKGDPDIDFQFAAEAIDITHHAGVDRVGLLGKDE